MLEKHHQLNLSREQSQQLMQNFLVEMMTQIMRRARSATRQSLPTAANGRGKLQNSDHRNHGNSGREIAAYCPAADQSSKRYSSITSGAIYAPSLRFVKSAISESKRRDSARLRGKHHHRWPCLAISATLLSAITNTLNHAFKTLRTAWNHHRHRQIERRAARSVLSIMELVWRRRSSRNCDRNWSKNSASNPTCINLWNSKRSQWQPDHQQPVKPKAHTYSVIGRLVPLSVAIKQVGLLIKPVRLKLFAHRQQIPLQGTAACRQAHWP